jgi:hypothetical protein
MRAVPVPICLEPSVTYPECGGGVPAGFVCQPIAAQSVGFHGCFPLPAATPCSDTCSPGVESVGACPPGYVCYADGFLREFRGTRRAGCQSTD